MYSNSLGDNVNSLLYNGFIEELVDILQLPDKNMLVSLSRAPLLVLPQLRLSTQYLSEISALFF